MRVVTSQKLNRRARQFRRAAASYLLLVGTSSLVAIIGLSVLASARRQRDALTSTQDWTQSRRIAFSAAQHALALLTEEAAASPSSDSLNTTDFSATVEGGTMSWRLRRPDGSVPTSRDDDLVLETAGSKGIAAYYQRGVVRATRTPHNYLSSALHCKGAVTVNSNSHVAFVGAPLTSPTSIGNSSTIHGDICTPNYFPFALCSGSVTIAAKTYDSPESGVVDDYWSKATPLTSATSSITEVVITPDLNPFGSTNADGLYSWDLQSSSTLNNARVRGTLVVRTNGHKLTITDGVLIENFREDYPALIIDGDACWAFDGGAGLLSEANVGINLNPPGAPYVGVTDTDTTDSYPSEIKGFVHVTGGLAATDTSRLNGACLVGGTTSVKDAVVISHDPTIVDTPPVGYGFVTAFTIAPGSWQRIEPW